MLKFDANRCDGCGLCEKSCPFGAITVAYDLAEANELCNLCGACVNVCPRKAITLKRKQASTEELARYRGVFIWAECESREEGLAPKKVVYELVTRGRALADGLGEELVAVVLGNERLSDLESLSQHGADRIICAHHALLDRYTTDGFAHVLAGVIAKEQPSIFLFGATPNGRDLAPRIAARLKLGLTADCTSLEIDENRQLLQTRPAFGGNIMASIITPYSRPQMATVRPNVFRAELADPERPVRIDEFPVRLNKAVIRTRITEKTQLDRGVSERIEEAKVIVSAGRGCQDPANLDMLRMVAEELGGVLAGSRSIVELGWIPHTLQVGQSGTTVAPDLYIAVGISGAVQHIAGMSSSKKIIAINKDPEAPIFRIADLAIVGDALDIMPKLLDQLRNRTGALRLSRREKKMAYNRQHPQVHP